MSLIDRGYKLLNRAREPAAATTVAYTRGAVVVSEALPASLTTPFIELLTDSGAQYVGRQFTWYLRRDELKGLEPERNDRIIWTFNGTKYTFEVLPGATGTVGAAVDPRSDWLPATVRLADTELLA